MGLLPVLVYYASVAKGSHVIAEYKNPVSSRDLAPVVVECMEQVPPLHSRFTITTKRRIFSCLIEGAFVYCSIVDEALGKGDAFGFLETVREEFLALLDARQLSRDGEGIEAVSAVKLGKEFSATLKVLTLPLIGVPQKEIDSLKGATPSGPGGNGMFDSSSPSMTDPLYSGSERSDGVPEIGRTSGRTLSNLLSGKNRRGAPIANGGEQQQRRHLLPNGAAAEEGKVEVVVVGGNQGQQQQEADLYPHRKSFSLREAEHRWWRNLKIVLVVDVVVCLVLFAIWLGICRGFQCVS